MLETNAEQILYIEVRDKNRGSCAKNTKFKV